MILLMLFSVFVRADGVDLQTPEELANARAIIKRDFAHAVDPSTLSPFDRVWVLSNYTHLDPNHEVPADLLQDTVLYFDTNKDSFPNKEHLVIVDFKPRSDFYRLYIVNMTNGSVEKFHTTHGINSDDHDYAVVFGNVIGSGKSSLGFIRTAEVYSGAYKRSLRLDGLSTTNSNIRDRAIVFHGWDKVKEANVIQGLSHGCITLDWTVKDAALDKIKGGALMYIGQTTIEPNTPSLTGDPRKLLTPMVFITRSMRFTTYLYHSRQPALSNNRGS